MTVALDAVLLAVSRHSLRRWLLALGGFGLIPLGLLDSSIIPLPGSMDLLTIVLSARQQSLWFYYAFMATAGSVLGASLTYKLARKSGKETLHRRLRHWRMDKVREMFARWGFSTVAVPALMPTAGANGSVRSCCGRHAISSEEVSNGDDHWPGSPVHGAGVSSQSIWPADFAPRAGYMGRL